MDSGLHSHSFHHHHPLVFHPKPLPPHHCHPHPHYHLQVSPHCPLHSHLLQPSRHPQACPNSIPLPLQPNSIAPPDQPEGPPSDTLLMKEETEVLLEEDEEEPIFVLTDEWKEFFAKSDAKRRLGIVQRRSKLERRQTNRDLETLLDLHSGMVAILSQENQARTYIETVGGYNPHSTF